MMVRREGSSCAWARRIMRNSILEELRRRRHEQIDSAHDPIDSDQQAPSEVLQKGLRLEALKFARDTLPEHQRVLIKLRIVSELSVREARRAITERLPSALADPSLAMVNRRHGSDGHANWPGKHIVKNSLWFIQWWKEVLRMRTPLSDEVKPISDEEIRRHLPSESRAGLSADSRD